MCLIPQRLKTQGKKFVFLSKYLHFYTSVLNHHILIEFLMIKISIHRYDGRDFSPHGSEIQAHLIQTPCLKFQGKKNGRIFQHDWTNENMNNGDNINSKKKRKKECRSKTKKKAQEQDKLKSFYAKFGMNTALKIEIRENFIALAKSKNL